MSAIAWLPIPGYEGRYDVSSDGQVRTWLSTSGSRRLQPMVRKKVRVRGYLAMCMLKISSTPSERKKVRTIHSMVAEAFIGPRPEGFDVNHIDGNKDNNRAENLEYATPEANEIHAQRNGLKVCGAKIWRAKLTDQKVIELRSDHRGGMSLAALSAKYGICKVHACDIARGRDWKHVPMGAR